MREAHRGGRQKRITCFLRARENGRKTVNCYAGNQIARKETRLKAITKPIGISRVIILIAIPMFLALYATWDCRSDNSRAGWRLLQVRDGIETQPEARRNHRVEELLRAEGLEVSPEVSGAFHLVHWRCEDSADHFPAAQVYWTRAKSDRGTVELTSEPVPVPGLKCLRAFVPMPPLAFATDPGGRGAFFWYVEPDGTLVKYRRGVGPEREWELASHLPPFASRYGCSGLYLRLDCPVSVRGLDVLFHHPQERRNLYARFDVIESRWYEEPLPSLGFPVQVLGTAKRVYALTCGPSYCEVLSRKRQDEIGQEGENRWRTRWVGRRGDQSDLRLCGQRGGQVVLVRSYFPLTVPGAGLLTVSGGAERIWKEEVVTQVSWERWKDRGEEHRTFTPAAAWGPGGTLHVIHSVPGSGRVRHLWQRSEWFCENLSDVPQVSDTAITCLENSLMAVVARGQARPASFFSAPFPRETSADGVERVLPCDTQGRTPLHHAVAAGDSQEVKGLLQAGYDPNRTDFEGNTSLHLAASLASVDVISLLVKSDAHIKVENASGHTPLALAIEAGNVGAVRALLEAGSDPEARGKYDCRVLYQAAGADKNAEKMVKLLLNYGADAAGGVGSRTALHAAADKGHTEVARILVRNGAKVNAKCRQGQTPLFVACRFGNSEVARLLLGKEAEIQVCDKFFGLTPFQAAVEWGHSDTANLFLAHGVALDAHAAVALNKPEMLQSMISKDPTLLEKRTSFSKSTLLHYAAREGNVRIAKMLLNQGVSVDSRDKAGRTPLHLAAGHGKGEMVDLLLKEGARGDAAVNGWWGQTPAHLASERGYLDVLQKLQSYGVDLSAEDQNGETALHYAARGRAEEAVRFLAEAGVRVDGMNRECQSALHLAATGQGDCVNALLLLGANPNATDENDRTPLHVAAKFGVTDVLQALLEAGASVSALDERGHLPIHLAARNGHDSCVQLLIREGSPLRSRNEAGLGALHEALLHGHRETAQLISASAEGEG